MAILNDGIERCSCGKIVFHKREITMLKKVRGTYVESGNTVQYVCLNCGNIIEERKA